MHGGQVGAFSVSPMFSTRLSASLFFASIVIHTHGTIKYHWSKKNVFTLINNYKEMDINMSIFWVRGINCFTFHLKFRKQNKQKKKLSQKHISFLYTSGDEKTGKKKGDPVHPFRQGQSASGTPPPSGVDLRSEPSCSETLPPLAQPGGGHPLRLRVQLVDQPAQLVESLVGIHVDDGGVKEVAKAVLHLAGLFCHFLQLLGLVKEKYRRFRTQRFDLSHVVLHSSEMLLWLEADEIVHDEE